MKIYRLFLLISFMSLLSVCTEAQNIFVSPVGSDHNPGTKEQPLGSVGMAVRKARELRRLKDPLINNGIRIIVAEGVYRFAEPLFIRPEDAGTASSPLIIEAATGALPVFSGGVVIKGWKPLASSKGKIWVAAAPLADFRQLWVNGTKAVRARERNADSMSRIFSWDHATETCKIPANNVPENTQQMEMVIHQWWAIAILRVSRAVINGDTAQLFFHQPESRVQSEHPWPAPWISKETGNSAFYLVNHMQFLDQPGEWFFDRSKQLLYYIPRAGEDMHNAEVIAPALETVVRIQGTRDNPVSHVYFKGISFQHTGWLRPSQQGHVPLQAGMYMLDAYKLKEPGTPDKSSLENQAWVGRPAAAVEASYTSDTRFELCRFEHMASTGLDYKKGNYHDLITGNIFKDIGGSGILLGVFSDEAAEVHLPYNPPDERELTTGLQVSNNFVTDVTNEDWGCVGIGAGYVRDISIHHNEVSEVSYTGISVGWGWTRTVNAMRNNKIFANRIHHYAKHMYDVAGIYTLSAQPGTQIYHNYIDSIYKAPYAHIPSHWFYLYTDEGSSYMTVKDNWCPSEKFLQNANGPGNVWQNNGPHVHDSIRLNAGIQPAYQYLVKVKMNSPPAANSHLARKKPVVVEVVSRSNIKRPLGKLMRQYGLSTSDLYQWSDHYAVFGEINDLSSFTSALQQRFPMAAYKVYDKPFYEFNRNRCADNTYAQEWDHVLLTAAVRKSMILDAEYMELHATQSEKWPEVSAGFCNASFQRLLLFRQGQQLMLVISIPKGKTLDELNPLTTANNPRMKEWNELMMNYQEGIPGAGLNTIWVLFK